MADVGQQDRTDLAEETGAQLREFCAELLEVDPSEVTEDEGLLGLGGNSLIATMLANRIELAWGSRPTMEELLICSLGELTDICAGLRAGEPLPAGANDPTSTLRS